MKYLLLSFLLLVFILGCDCEEPPYLALPDPPAKIISPEAGFGGWVANVTDSDEIIIEFNFSEPMDINSIVLDDNTLIYVEGSFVSLNGTFSWPAPDKLVFTSTPNIYNNPNVCLPGCSIYISIRTDDVGVVIRGIDGQILDGDCNGTPEGTYETRLIAD